MMPTLPIYLLLCGIILLILATEKVTRPFDVTIVLVAMIVVALTLVVLKSRASAAVLEAAPTESFEQRGPSKTGGIPLHKPFDGQESIDNFPVGLSVYLSCYSDKSYPDGKSASKQWTNIAPLSGSDAAASSPSSSSPPSRSSGNTNAPDRQSFNFYVTPTFSRRDGFVMRRNGVSGPYSVDLGIRGDMTYTIFFVASGRHLLDEDDRAKPHKKTTVFQLYANTPGMNGVSLTVSAPTTAASKTPQQQKTTQKQKKQAPTTTSSAATAPPSSTTKVDMQLRVGQHDVISCRDEHGGPVQVNTNHKYLYVIQKDFGSARVTLIDIDAQEGDGAGVMTTLAHETLSTRATQVHFSNKDMTINEHRNWNANLLAFGMYDRAISDREIITLYDHYRSIHKQADPMYVRLLKEIRKREALKACPFNARACSLCSEVKDWTDFQSVVTASDDCKAAIAKYCSDNPTHEKCACWSVNHPNYSTSCKAYRCAVGGSKTQPECKTENKSATPSSAPSSAPPLTRQEIRHAVAEAIRDQQQQQHDKTGEPSQTATPSAKGKAGVGIGGKPPFASAWSTGLPPLSSDKAGTGTNTSAHGVSGTAKSPLSHPPLSANTSSNTQPQTSSWSSSLFGTPPPGGPTTTPSMDSDDALPAGKQWDGANASAPSSAARQQQQGGGTDKHGTLKTPSFWGWVFGTQS